MCETFDTDVNPAHYSKNNLQGCARKFRNKSSYAFQNFINPKMIGYFSVNEHREFMPDASQLRYLKMPNSRNVDFDLNNGIEEFRPKPESVKQEKMDFLLRYIVNNIEKLRVKNGHNCHQKLLNSDIICSRGRLVQIMCPSSVDRKWSLIASKFKGNVYICLPDGDDFPTKQTAYGFKFEQYMLSDNPLVDPITNVPVIESEEFYGVFEGHIGNLSLLYNAEMDGVDSRVELNLEETNFEKLKFVELKTCLGSIGKRACRWWAHSYLAQVSQITVGYRNHAGIVKKLEKLSTDELSSRMEVNWTPNSCLQLLKTFLNHVHLVCRSEQDPHSVYKFDYDHKVKDTIQCTIYRGKNKYSFLPEWYIKEVN